MSKFFKPKSILIAFLVAATALSCSSDDNSDITIPPPDADDPVATFDAELFVSAAGGDMRDVTVEADGSTGMEITSRVQFTSASANMRRLYITKEVDGGAPEPFEFISQEVDEKPDGSLDLVGDNKENFEFQINLAAPMAEGGSIIYTFWATTGRGDFRDISKRNAIGDTAFGTITVNFGTPDMGSDISVYTQTMLAAPTADGTSPTFMSLFDGTVYKINEGVAGEEGEKAALWDIGYYYGNTQLASLASPNNYPTNIVDVPAISGLPADELNQAFFSLSATTLAEFEGITTSAQLDVIATPTAQRINGLAENDVISFVDNYGNKGLIRVDNVTGTFNQGDSITITIKVQR